MAERGHTCCGCCRACSDNLSADLGVGAPGCRLSCPCKSVLAIPTRSGFRRVPAESRLITPGPKMAPAAQHRHGLDELGTLSVVECMSALGSSCGPPACDNCMKRQITCLHVATREHSGSGESNFAIRAPTTFLARCSPGKVRYETPALGISPSILRPWLRCPQAYFCSSVLPKHTQPPSWPSHAHTYLGRSKPGAAEIITYMNLFIPACQSKMPGLLILAFPIPRHHYETRCILPTKRRVSASNLDGAAIYLIAQKS